MSREPNAKLDDRARSQVLRRRDRFAMLLGVLTPMTREEAIALFEPLPSRRPRMSIDPRETVDLLDQEDYRRIAV